MDRRLCATCRKTEHDISSSDVADERPLSITEMGRRRSPYILRGHFAGFWNENGILQKSGKKVSLCVVRNVFGIIVAIYSEKIITSRRVEVVSIYFLFLFVLLHNLHFGVSKFVKKKKIEYV